MVFLVRQVQGVFTSSPFRGDGVLLRWILSCGEKVANFRVTRYLSGPKHTAFCDLPSSPHYAVRPCRVLHGFLSAVHRGADLTEAGHR